MPSKLGGPQPDGTFKKPYSGHADTISNTVRLRVSHWPG
jgi:hypothetical protein